ncbi:deacetylase sulfotransferase [Micractinium conductrix]|uniref:Deacetylase sulfotransferase n=1 Tax=Micractinium conductrix TaxID=554055 RepID=A0A2P6V1X9_9CHLO|nr:deacetylase sulfotransferase [Micractinium conductrix]|eukprot:PSC68100.1 deacetylase sulfotransferase [Micractinium conductrix]
MPDGSPLGALDTHTPEQRQQAEAFATAVAACQDFDCLRQANELPRAPGQFRFPHFMVIGFPKCATTSIYCHLIQHPAVQHPKEKESHWLTQRCGPRSLACSNESQQHYIQEILNMPEAAAAKITKAAFEGSTHYVLESEWLPQQLAATFPWLRVVVSLRDPISQAIAMHLHNVMHARDSNCTRGTDSIYHCIRKALKPGSRSHYPSKIADWMKLFPQQQLHFMQYENVTQQDSMAGELTSLKAFLGLDPALPSSQLPLTNYKHVHTGHGPDALGRYWVMKRWELEHLVSIARNNTRETVELLRQHGAAGQQQLERWAAAWERVWEDNLGRCEEGRSAPCKVIVS